MKSLLYTSLLSFILFISVNSSCDGDAANNSYSVCKSKGSNCCFIIVYYKDSKNKDQQAKQCGDSSSVSNIITTIESRIGGSGGTVSHHTIQCDTNSYNYLKFNLLVLIILFYVIVC